MVLIISISMYKYIYSYNVILLTKYIIIITPKDICNQWAHLNFIHIIIIDTVIYLNTLLIYLLWICNVLDTVPHIFLYKLLPNYLALLY